MSVIILFGNSFAEFPESVQAIIDRAAEAKGVKTITDWNPATKKTNPNQIEPCIEEMK